MVKEAMQKNEELMAYDHAVKLNTVVSYRRFIDKYPESVEYNNAKATMKKILLAKDEKTFYEYHVLVTYFPTLPNINKIWR